MVTIQSRFKEFVELDGVCSLIYWTIPHQIWINRIGSFVIRNVPIKWNTDAVYGIFASILAKIRNLETQV